MAKNDFDLTNCAVCTDELHQKKYAKTLHPDNIEDIFRGISQGKEHLTLRKLKRLNNSKDWIFKDYWILPSSRNLVKDLKKTRGTFTDLPKNETQVIKLLYDIFKNIEVVSIILRFIDPVNYGVISPPVRYAIQQMLTPGWDYVNEYIDYLSLLREQKPVYGFLRVADLENALWTLVEKCLRSNDATCPNLKRFRERFLTIQEHLLLEQYKEEEFLERIGQLEKEIQAHKKTESELEDTYVSDMSRLEAEKARTEEDLKNIRSEKTRLESANRHFMPDLLFNIPDSPRSPEEKLVHEEGHMVDRNQHKFMQKLLNFKKIHHVIWSENITVKPPARISAIKPDGEVVIYYVGESNYSAKIKVYPAIASPDLTHAKYFALLISGYMGIRNEHMS